MIGITFAAIYSQSVHVRDQSQRSMKLLEENLRKLEKVQKLKYALKYSLECKFIKRRDRVQNDRKLLPKCQKI